MNAVITGVIAAACPSIIVAIIMLCINRKIDRHDEANVKFRERQIKAEALTMELSSAAASLSLACAVAMKRGSTNGEVEAAIKEYNEAKKNYYSFINKSYIEYKLEEEIRAK